MHIPANPNALAVSLQQFSYFLAAVEHGSLSAAAEANYIAQPSLSDQIRRMERTLGVTLFIRTNRALILTDAAQTLVPYAEKAVSAAYDAVESMTPVRDLTGGTVTFGTFSTARHLFHTDLITRFRSSFPGVNIRVIGDNSVKIADEVREGRVEAGVVALPVDDRGLDTEPLTWSPQICYFSRHADSARIPKTIRDIAEANLVMPEVQWGDSDPIRRRLMEVAQREGLRVVPRIEVAPYTALELAANGLADTVAPYSLAQATGLVERLHWAPLSPPMREDFAFITRRNATLSPGTRVIRSIVEKLVANIPTDPE